MWLLCNIKSQKIINIDREIQPPPTHCNTQVCVNRVDGERNYQTRYDPDIIFLKKDMEFKLFDKKTINRCQPLGPLGQSSGDKGAGGSWVCSYFQVVQYSNKRKEGKTIQQ